MLSNNRSIRYIYNFANRDIIALILPLLSFWPPSYKLYFHLLIVLVFLICFLIIQFLCYYFSYFSDYSMYSYLLKYSISQTIKAHLEDFNSFIPTPTFVFLFWYIFYIHLKPPTTYYFVQSMFIIFTFSFALHVFLHLQTSIQNNFL